MNALSIVLQHNELNELYALRKHVTLPKLLTITDGFYDKTTRFGEDVEGFETNIANFIVFSSLRIGPQETLLKLATYCEEESLPFPGTWESVVTSTQSKSDSNHNCFGSQWDDSKKLFIFIGIFGDDDQDQYFFKEEHETWVDKIWKTPLLTARKLMNVGNKILLDNVCERIDPMYDFNNCGISAFTVDTLLNPE